MILVLDVALVHLSHTNAVHLVPVCMQAAFVVVIVNLVVVLAALVKVVDQLTVLHAGKDG